MTCKYCLRHGHDWQYYTYDCQKCSICGAIRQTLDEYNRAGLFSVPCYSASPAKRLRILYSMGNVGVRHPHTPGAPTIRAP